MVSLIIGRAGGKLAEAPVRAYPVRFPSYNGLEN